MKSDKTPVIVFICVMLSCILVLGITIGILSSANNNTVAAGATTDTTDTTDNTPETPEESPIDEPEPELYYGYKFKKVSAAIDGCSVGDIAYKSTKSTFNVEEVTLTVSFGSLGAKLGPDKWTDVPEFDIYFVDSSGESVYTLKTIKEQFFSEKYGIYRVDDETDSRYYYYEYAHTEEITIPQELFTESEGVISICIGGINVAENSPNNYYLILDQAEIKYKLNGMDQVVLSKPYTDHLWYY